MFGGFEPGFIDDYHWRRIIAQIFQRCFAFSPAGKGKARPSCGGGPDIWSRWATSVQRKPFRRDGGTRAAQAWHGCPLRRAPLPRQGCLDPSRGILIDRGDAAATAASFLRTTGDADEAARFAAFGDRLLPLAETLFPTVTEPLRRALPSSMGPKSNSASLAPAEEGTQGRKGYL